MKPIAQITSVYSRMIAVAVAILAAVSMSGRLQAADGYGLRGTDQAQSGGSSQLRLLQPAPKSHALPVRPAKQPELTPPGQPVGPAPRPLPLSAPSVDDVSVGIKPIGQVNINISLPPTGNAGEQAPADLAAPKFAKAGEVYPPASEYRPWLASSYFWEAPGASHNPLYFEEINVERYGYNYGHLQPLVSAAHFFGTIPLLPYEMVVHPLHEEVYSLGYYRPGDPYELQRRRFELRADAGAVETGIVIGTILLLH